MLHTIQSQLKVHWISGLSRSFVALFLDARFQINLFRSSGVFTSSSTHFIVKFKSFVFCSPFFVVVRYLNDMKFTIWSKNNLTYAMKLITFEKSNLLGSFNFVKVNELKTWKFCMKCCKQILWSIHFKLTSVLLVIVNI